MTNELIPFPVPNDSNEYEEESYTRSKKSIYPISFILTEFHVVLLYSDHVTALSLLNYQIVYEEYFDEQFGKLMNIVKDSSTETIYVHTGRNIFRYKVSNERRNVWRMYLDKNEFELAKQYSRENPAHMDIVMVKQAELFYSHKDYLKSAQIYAETQSSFEDVCLKFLDISEYEALMVFLRNRIENSKQQDKTQITMLVVWIVELYLTQIARFSTEDQQFKVRKLQNEFDAFIKTPRVVECVRNNRTVIYDLMASHGDNFNLTSLTTVNKDFESVINQYINQCKFTEALSILKSQNKADLYYKYSSIIMEEEPKETISAIIGQGRRLDPVRLLPTLVCLDTDAHRSEVIRYLEFCILSLGSTEQSIHNFLVQLYAEHRADKLMGYLEMQTKDVTLLHYDVHYALR